MSRVIEGPFIRGEGFEWLLSLPQGEAGASDTAEAPSQSKVRLWEDNRLLTPHALHSEIVTLGEGRFSHWGGWLRFSSSDGSDPNANGRIYSISLDETMRPTLLAMGSCHMHSAVRALVREGAVEQIWAAPGLSYSPGETLQLLRHYSGEEAVPPALSDLALSASPTNTLGRLLGRADFAAVEFSALTDIAMSGIRLIRSRVDDILIAPFFTLGPAEGALARRWYVYGLLQGKEAVRRSAADEMLPLLARIPEAHPLAREVLLAARGLPSTIERALQDFQEIERLLGAPRIALMLSHNLFTPRGDPISWDGYFPEMMHAAALGLGVHAFLSSEVVFTAGVEAALQPDLLHFRPTIDPAIGAAILSALGDVNGGVEASKGDDIGAGASEGVAVRADPFYAALAEAVAEEWRAPASSISPEGTAADVPGWDSLGHIRIVMNLEARLGRTIDMRASYAAADFEALRALFMA